MNIGDILPFRARKADGSIYRSWRATIETLEPGLIVTIAPPGSIVQDHVKGQYALGRSLRSYYWFDKFYNLLEIFEADGRLGAIYINIAAPPSLDEDGGISFIDHELDVWKEFPHPAELVDEDEFAEAIHKYRYTEEFQRHLYATAREALTLADHWQARPAPRFGGDHA